mmetsp:Transcript_90195/g.291565  ORF Transcript_90195/g.291565 Transcript_90195/m.291565 type:complete len:241 (+) Transcript_90195:1791-2513(+)
MLGCRLACILFPSCRATHSLSKCCAASNSQAPQPLGRASLYNSSCPWYEEQLTIKLSCEAVRLSACASTLAGVPRLLGVQLGTFSTTCMSAGRCPDVDLLWLSFCPSCFARDGCATSDPFEARLPLCAGRRARRFPSLRPLLRPLRPLQLPLLLVPLELQLRFLLRPLLRHFGGLFKAQCMAATEAQYSMFDPAASMAEICSGPRTAGADRSLLMLRCSSSLRSSKSMKVFFVCRDHSSE